MSHRNGSLDLLRALAITMVVACHLANAFARGSPLAVALGVGGRGVDLFFVLSGWLLGRQLFAEAVRTGTVDVRRFWVRRWLRTLPAYYAVLLAHCALLAARGKADMIDWHYFVFLQNYLDHLPFFAVSWSLCVEEHFYLVIAPAVLLGWRSRWAAGAVAVTAAVLIAMRNLGMWTQVNDEGMSGATHVRFQQCLIGVLLAWVAVNRPRAWEHLARRAGLFAAVGLVVFVGAAVNRFGWWLPDPGDGGWAVVFASWVLLGVSGPRWEGLHWRPAALVASRAYSVYLVHNDAFNFGKIAGEKLGLPAAAQAGLSMALCVAAAEVLYRLVERPFMRLRDRRPTETVGSHAARVGKPGAVEVSR